MDLTENYLCFIEFVRKISEGNWELKLAQAGEVVVFLDFPLSGLLIALFTAKFFAAKADFGVWCDYILARHALYLFKNLLIFFKALDKSDI